MLAILLGLIGVAGLAGMAGGGSGSDSATQDSSAGPTVKGLTRPPVEPDSTDRDTDTDTEQNGPTAPTAPVVLDSEPDDIVKPESPVKSPAKPPVSDSGTVTGPVVPQIPDNTDTVTGPVLPEIPDETDPILVDAPGVPSAPGGQVVDGDNSVAPIAVTGNSVSVLSGRVTTLDLGGDQIAGVEVRGDLPHGNVTVNPDNTLALVLSGTDKTSDMKLSLRITHDDGSVVDKTINVNVEQGPQASGWGEGKFYMLETDADDNLIVEHGENHREVYVSGDKDALSLKDIAALEGVSVDKINGRFLVAHSEYGASEDMALAEDAGNILWGALTAREAEPSSHWLMLEKGHDYSDISILRNGTVGESALNPVYISSYGEGDAPVITYSPQLTKDGAQNIVISGLDFSDGVRFLAGKNILVEDSTLRGNEANFSNIEGFTLRNSMILDAAQDAPNDPEDGWKGMTDRESGLYMGQVKGSLIEGNVFDHNGWAEGYDPDMSSDSVHPPSMYSHNAYLAKTNRDVTFSDNIVMRGASAGLQLRGGGVIEDNVFLDNNVAVLIGDGGAKPVGNYSLFSGNVVTSAGYHQVDKYQGALGLGIDNKGNLATLVDNIVAHLADPNNPAELAAKAGSQPALTDRDVVTAYNDTIIYNWAGSNRYEGYRDERDTNVENLNHDILDETTIQHFAGQLLGKDSASIGEFADYLRHLGAGAFDDVVDADLIIDFFQTGFGIPTTLRAEAETVRFVPDALADGMRWDNKMNWSTDDLPGTQDGDSVNLAGNWVQYGRLSTTIEDLHLGNGGKLDLASGALHVNDHLSVGDKGGEITIENSGQFWTDGYTDKDMLTINADGGRFVNTGLFTGTTDFTVSGNAQAILATDGADFVLNPDSHLQITGGNAKVGFDGQQGGTGVLLMADNSSLEFTSEGGKLGLIREFYSGSQGGDAPNIQSGVNLGQADLKLDLTSIAAGGAAFNSTLIKVDELIGKFDQIEFLGLGAKQDASVIVNYETDTVTLNVGEAGKGSGVRKMYFNGNEADAKQNADLWAALTNGHGIYADDPASSIPPDEDDGIDI